MPQRSRVIRWAVLTVSFTVVATALVCNLGSPSELVNHKEALLRQNLFALRFEISQYTLDKQKAPQSLDDVISAGYLKVIPTDPMTGSSNWATEQEDSLMAVDRQEPGIVDVHSASDQTASDGTAYSSW